jgi:cytochrome b subunit of formate dehydrogenase
VTQIPETVCRLLLPPALALAVVLVLIPANGAMGQAFSSEDCATCHTDSGGDPPEVSSADMAGGVHEGFECTDCHTGIAELPHSEELPPAACGQCHEDVAEVYQWHGRGRVGESPYIPSCPDCHGAHRILPVLDRHAAVNPLNLPTTCGRCHEDSTLLADLGIRVKHPIRMYASSVHGRATAGGIHNAASCNDCHSTGGSSHLILSPSDSRSTISHFNIPKTCGRCHTAIEQDYWEGIHGQITARGEVDTPICTSCHGEHGILPTDDPRSPVSPHRLAEATCTPCHESALLNEKYDLPLGRLQSFVDSYHGLKSQAGDKTVANCASCHGAHLILPASDPRSTVNPGNLPHTCGRCHPGISPGIATVPIHATATGLRTGLARIVQIFYVILIVIVIGGMIVHWLLDLFRQVATVLRAKPSLRRMEPLEVLQHTVLALAFTVLVVTGFSLRFYDAWWSTLLFGHEGGYTVRGMIHRVAGIALLLGAFWHAGFLLTPRGRGFWRDMMPTGTDVRHFWLRVRFNLGRTSESPAFGRFSYVEKAEYWALIWGTAIMVITGFALWFDNAVVTVLPKGALDVILIIHYYEAWLAFLAILIWHMYATVFSPDVYPMNPSWITGKMPVEMFRHEHGGVDIGGESQRDKNG